MKEKGEVIYTNQGISIVVQHNLRVFNKENDKDWLHKNVFHTRCTAKWKVYLVIIDSGSLENVVPM